MKVRKANRKSRFSLALLAAAFITLICASPAVADINIVDIREASQQLVPRDYVTRWYEPAHMPATGIAMDPQIKYTITTPGYYRIRLYDRGANVYRLEKTFYHSAAGTYWLTGTSMSWPKTTPDSLQYEADMWNGSSWLLRRDYAIGPVTGITEIGHNFNWSPNQYTWGYASYNGDLVTYNFHFWWWNRSSTFTRGTERLNQLKSILDGHLDSQLQIEFLRTQTNGTADQDGWDAIKYLSSPMGWIKLYWGQTNNLPGDVYEEGEEDWSDVVYHINENEEIQVIAEEPELFTTITGSDPTNVYASGYVTRITFWRHPNWRGYPFWMRISMEAKESFYDNDYDVTNLAIHTTTF
jgi:hypothetical protein